MAYDVSVVGGGIIGTASAYYLAKKDLKVALLDQGALSNPVASSCDHVRVFRLTHGKDSFYTDLARKTIPLWSEFQTEAREDLIQQNGMLEFAVGKTGYEDQSAKVLEEMKIPVQKLKSQVVCDRYRMMKHRSFKYALYHPDGGMIWAKKAIEAFRRLSVKIGVHTEHEAKIVKVIKKKAGIEGLKDSNGKVWKAKNYVFASGAWTGDVLKDFKLPLTVTRQEAIYIRPPRNQGRYRPAHFPVFTVSSKGFYGMPVHIHGFMKIGSHKKGTVVRKVVTPIEPDKKFEAKARAFLKTIIPDLCDFTDIEGKVYYYTRTPDNDFLLDKLGDLPNAWVAAGFSGHGPMYAPLIGRTVAEMVSGEKPEINLQRFRLDRFKRKKKK
jgi:N-methyl-L-tryptophan oxidase